MFLGRFSRKKTPLTGVPAVRRLKTYSAESGYVYQYYFEGKRETEEFVFSFTADRKNWREVSVVVPKSHFVVRGRELTSTDRYAIAKVALFATFDRCASPAELPHPIRVGEPELEEAAGRLGW